MTTKVNRIALEGVDHVLLPSELLEKLMYKIFTTNKKDSEIYIRCRALQKKLQSLGLYNISDIQHTPIRPKDYEWLKEQYDLIF